MSFYIAGTGAALPNTAVTNDALSKMMDTSDEWISSRTGIHERRVITDETLTDLSVAAAERALADAGLKGEQVDLVLCATMEGDTITPSQACAVSERLGVHAPSFDVNAACSGFLYCWDIADSFFRTGKAETVLVVACEALSKQVDWADRRTCVLFGDGAGAVVLRKGDGLKSCHIACVPNAKMIYTPAYDGESPFFRLPRQKSVMRMDGQEVYKFAVNTMMAEIEIALQRAGLTAEDIDYVLPHQANLRIIDAAKKRFGLSDEKVLVNMSKYGNMSATSIPVLLDENARAGMFRTGNVLLLVAFGAGMTSAAAVVQWRK